MDRYDVIVQALDEGADSARAAATVARVLDTSERRAWELLTTLPATVREDADEREAESMLHALREVGVRVRLKKKTASRVSMPRAAPDAPASVRPAARPGAPPIASGPSLGEPDRGRPDPGGPGLLGPSPSGPSPSGSGASGPIVPGPIGSGPSALDLHAPELPPHGALPEMPLPALELDLPVPATRPRAPAPAAPVPSPSTPLARELDDDTVPPRFWGALPGALIYPLRGPGWRYLVLGVFLSPIVPIAILFASWMRYYGLPVLYGASAIWLGYLLSWFRACCFGTMTGGTEPEGLPESGTWRDRFQEGGFLGVVLIGLGVLGFVVLSTAAHGAMKIGDVGTHGIALLVLYGAMFLYWPIGVGLVAARHSMLAFFDFAVAVRAVRHAPLEMIAIIALSVVAQGIAASVVFWVGLASMLMSSWGFVLVLALAALPTAYVHAVMGTAMGLLFRVKPDVFV